MDLWELLEDPVVAIVLSEPTAITTVFGPDEPGNYVTRRIVNDA